MKQVINIKHPGYLTGIVVGKGDKIDLEKTRKMLLDGEIYPKKKTKDKNGDYCYLPLTGKEKSKAVDDIIVHIDKYHSDLVRKSQKKSTNFKLNNKDKDD